MNVRFTSISAEIRKRSFLEVLARLMLLRTLCQVDKRWPALVAQAFRRFEFALETPFLLRTGLRQAARSEQLRPLFVYHPRGGGRILATMHLREQDGVPSDDALERRAA